MEQVEVIIERIKEINAEYQHIEITVDGTLARIKPGQSLLARVNTQMWHPYLREHWWPVDIRPGNKLIIERPARERYKPGQVINMLGLIGKPYRFRRTLRNVLLVAYDTPPTTLLLTIPWLLGNQVSVTIVLLGTARAYPTAHLPAEVEVILGENDVTEPLRWNDQVMTVGWADQIFVSVAADHQFERFKMVLRRFEELRASLSKDYLFGVFNPPTPCGSGACQACALQLQGGERGGEKLSCIDGPAFDLTQVVLS